MLDIKPRHTFFEDQVENTMSTETSVARIESHVVHLNNVTADIKLDMREFRTDLQNMRKEMHGGLEAANEATARLELALCETRMEQKNLRSEQESLRTEQQAMRADMQAMRVDLQAMQADQAVMRTDIKAVRTDLDAVRTDQKVMRAELKGDIAAL